MKTEHLQLAVQLRHRLHQHPELSYQEVWTKETLMAFLREHTDLTLYDRGKYFYAVYRCNKEKKDDAIAFRADFDALPIEDEIDKPYRSEIPGVGHKCGHDGHAATLCGLGLELNEMEPDRDVYLVFQHAEETGQGAIEAKNFLIENPDIAEIYAYHNQTECETGTVLVHKGSSNCASKGMTIKMVGAPTHASLPEKGKNPVFALAHVVGEIPRIADSARYEGNVLCTVVQLDVGEYAFGVAADRGILRMTIRGENEEEMNRMQVELMELAQQEAAREGVSCEFSFEDVFPETRNNAACAEKVLQAAAKVGLKAVENHQTYRGSEDFGYFLKERPGALFFVGNGEACPSFHTVEYDFNDEVIPYAVELFKALICLPTARQQ